MLYDTLTCNGVEKSFNGWNFSARLKGRKRQSARSTFECTIPGASIATEATTPTFPFEAPIVVRINRASADGTPNSFSGGTVKFQGKRVGQPLRASARGVGVTYQFADAFYDLENTHYQQNFQGANGVNYVAAETVLNTSTAVGAGQIFISVGDQLQAILQWLLDQYAAQGMAAPYQYRGRLLNNGAIDLNGNAGVFNFGLDPAPTISPAFYGITYPSYITKPLMCADALKKMLELSPRANLWFDHTTLPPTGHVSLPADMPPVTLPLFDGVSHKDVSLQRRDDLLVRAVNILYRITSSINGQQVLNYFQDKWGPNGSNNAADPQTGLRVVAELIDLSGGSLTTTYAHLTVAPVLALAASGGTSQALKRGWWQNKVGGEVAALEDSRVRFQDKNFAQTTIPDAVIYDTGVLINDAAGRAPGSLNYQPTNPTLSAAQLIAAGFCDRNGSLVLNRIVSGTHHAWMVRADGQPVVFKKVKLMARMTYAEYDVISPAANPDTDHATGRRKSARASVEHHVNFEITNGTTGQYQALESFTAGETALIGAGGIAQYLFNHLNTLQYDGDAVHVAASFADKAAANYIDLGNTLNLANGAPEWAAMNAQVQEIEEDYFTHETTVQIGVAKHLNAGQLSSILNMWRNRRPWYNPLVRSNNAAGGSGGLVDMPLASGGANSVKGLEVESLLQLLNYTTDGDPTTPVLSGVKLDATALTANRAL